MCITVGGAKRNLRIGIPNPTKGRQSLGESPSPSDCVGVSRLVLRPERTT
ncbi:MAG: hypothetical protein LBU34_03230 [Planctomycetaceae bacterium]|nr:hypothetical protein [Planctomycetaceae bacterium]